MNATANINDEWENFISSNGDDDIEDNDYGEYGEEIVSNNIANELCPKASPIYISTKTNISYLNKMVDLKTVFWKIPIIPYAVPVNGVVKKQMKMNSLTIEELEDIQEKLKNEECVEENVITSINNPTGRIKFKDIRKVSVGISKKDLVSYRCKKKSAFYNCFVMILRIKMNEVFKEFHVKVFNTGKLEIPGIQTEEAFQEILAMVIHILDPIMSNTNDTITRLEYQENTTETVLINSNFNCGFYINRETLFEMLKYKYNIQCIYDPCSYPGIQCKFYYNKEKGIQTGIQSEKSNQKQLEIGGDLSEEKVIKKMTKTKLKSRNTNSGDIPVSFMIFRTGSVLIVGKCDESVLHIIYDFLKNLLLTEFSSIMLKITDDTIVVKDKKRKMVKKQITVTHTQHKT
jgi:hypothetical protein